MYHADVAELRKGPPDLRIARAHQRFRHLVDARVGARQTVAGIAQVRDIQHRIPAQLLLDVEVPLLGIAQLAGLLDESGREDHSAAYGTAP